MEWTRMRPAERRREGPRNGGVPQVESQRSAAVLRGLGSLLRRYTVKNERLRVCETLSLGGRRGVALIECDGECFLAGMSAGGVETLIPVQSVAATGEAR